ncbi:MAG: universal stress protein [Bacteroidales bacterium]|nr:universal stress protein [Bacteroidales bacterium]
MKLLEKILVPVDVNTGSEEQINATIRLANVYNSEILLMYVAPDKELNEEIKNIVLKSITESLNEIKEILESNKVKVREPIIAFGSIADTIAQKGNLEKVNLVLIGANKKKKRAKFKLGIIAEQIIRISDVPVWLVNAEQKTFFKHLLCPVDFSEPSKRALSNAILLARKHKSTLSILTVYEPLASVSKKINIDLEEENASRLKRVKNEMDTFIKDLDLEGVDHKIEIKSGIADKKILNIIKKQNIDLLIMGTNGRTGLNRFFMGSVTEKVIREMPCSFITIKKTDIIKLKIDNEIKEIEAHFKNGEELIKNALYEDAIDQFLICLEVNDMHIPSMHKLTEIYDKTGDAVKSLYYKNMAKEILSKLWDRKIEVEIRRHYRLLL